MSTSTLVHGELTIEAFFDRKVVVLALLKKGEVVSRVTRDLSYNCFALTVEHSGQQETLMATRKLTSWRWTTDGVVTEQAGKTRWLGYLGQSSRAVYWRELGLYGAGLAATYFAAAWALSPWNDILGRMWHIPVLVFLIPLFQAGAAKRELDRQAGLVVNV